MTGLDPLVSAIVGAWTNIIDWWQRSPKAFKRFIIYGVIPIALVSAGIFVGAKYLSPEPPEPPPLGLDLNGYCQSYDLKYANETCAQDLDLRQACEGQYGPNKHTVDFNPNDKYSAKCLRPDQREPVGGIVNISDHCKKKYLNVVNVGAWFDDKAKKWLCRFKIDYSAACVWRYGTSDLKARRAEDGTWNCVKS
ncbi:hypothetical protein [Thermomonospora umbrina]|uniref:Uncharacterized protein n=1 Tax=Thermomonospora umbrina TaxID=111806 RepID=A0A3D9SXJ1_9ACTN|nr:hypothetical protein [Thermomonospora umbrina]REF00569.1 hypothetical protein DFJ69_6119 [Thermomonospora umbrina]